MLNELILYNDIAGSIDFQVTATNEYPGAEANFAVTNEVKNPAMSTGIGTWYLTLDGAAGHPIKAVAVLGINTATWSILKAQASNNNFGTVSAEVDLTVVSRPLSIYNEATGKMQDYTRYDAYALVDWNYQDYRIAMDSAAVSQYEIGRVYLAEETFTIEKESELNQPAGLVTASVTIDGQDGPYLDIGQFQRMRYNLDFQGITKVQADLLTGPIRMNPTVCYFIDGPTLGELFYGSFRFEPRTVQGRALNADKIFLRGVFQESL